MAKALRRAVEKGEDVESLARQAYVRLRDAIVTLQIKPGALLSETTLGQSMGISRTPIREALQRLERDYLVAVLPRRGIVVTEIDLGQQLLLVDIRRGIETTLFSRAAERATEAQLARFKALAIEMEASARHNDMIDHYRVDKQFDDLIDLTAGNRFLTDSLRPVHSLVRRFWQSHSGGAGTKGALDHHVVVAHAVASGDSAAVGEATRALFDFNEAFIRKQLG